MIDGEVDGSDVLYIGADVHERETPANVVEQSMRSAWSLPELIQRIEPEPGEEIVAERNVRRAAANTTLTDSDYMLEVDCSAGCVTVSLPSATHMGDEFVVVKIDATANSVTLVPFGNDTLQGSASKSLTVQYDKIRLVADGVSMWIIETENQV
jgi:hypothetical protein